MVVFLVVFMIGVLLSACGARETETPIPTKTLRPSPTPQPTKTRTPSPTPTLIPSPTNTPLPTPISEGGEWVLVEIDEENLVERITVNATIQVACGILENILTGATVDVWCMRTTCAAVVGTTYTYNGALFAPLEDELKQVQPNFSLLEG